VEVYALTATGTVTEDAVLRHGTRVAALAVKAPRDPDRTVEAEEPEADVEPPQGAGLDQGVVARVDEPLAGAALVPVDVPSDEKKQNRRTAAEDGETPLLGPAGAAVMRNYVALGISTRGRRGPVSKRTAVPLVAAPAAPSDVALAYTESAVTVTWMPVRPAGMVQEPDGPEVIPSTPIGMPAPKLAYHVYDVSSPDNAAAARLTVTPVGEPRFEDSRIAWGERRCYTVRAVELIDGLAIEGDAAPPRCKTLADTFPPVAPKGLQAVAHEGSISLIWDPNNEKDLAGYLVFRGTAPGEASEQMTPAPIEQAMFNDTVMPAVRYVYVIKAVDRAGNASPPSAPVEGTAR
jgi:hypothetical protein